MTRAVAKVRPEPGGLELVEHRPGPPRPDEVALRVLHAGICGTDLELRTWSPWLAGRVRPPVVIGHEAVGVITAVGSPGNGLAAGDLVALESHLACGTCRNCRTGKAHVCLRLRYLGVDFDGVLADEAVVPAVLARRLPAGVAPEVGALLEPFGLAVRAAASGGGVTERTVVVTGAGGPLGLMTVLAARHLGAGAVVAAEAAPGRLEHLRRHAAGLGLARVVDVGAERLGDAVREVAGPEGCEVWIDLAGTPEALRAGLDAVAPGGEARLLGTRFEPVAFNLTQLILKEVAVQPIHGRLLWASWAQALDILPDIQDDLRLLLTHRVALGDFEAAFAVAQEGTAVKVLLSP